MIKFNLTKTTATPVLDLIELLEIKLSDISNKYDVISTFCEISEEIYSAVSSLMPFIENNGEETVLSVSNAILSGEWVIESI